jgi:CubicO group peptidase (beta-lactamase class C family)
MARYHIPGLAAAVSSNGTVLLARGYGTANLEHSNAATPESVFLLGSLTKPFTATAIMLLVQDGKIDLNQPIASYLKDLPLPEPVRPVTVRQLLSHTSGIVDFHDIPGSIRYARMDRLPREVIGEAIALPLKFKPGEQFWYSSSNYILLGMIIERVSGKRFGAFVAERIFRPLQMGSTTMQNLRSVIPKRVAGYNWVNGNWLNADYISPSHLYAAGGALSTVLDLAKWDEGLFSGRIVGRDSLMQMLAPAILARGERANYGLGIELTTDRGHRIAGHSDEIFGFNTTLYRYLDDNLMAIVLANEGDAPTEALAMGLVGIFLGLPDVSYSKRSPIADGEPELAEALGRVIAGAATGKVDASLFAPPAANELGPLIERVGPRFLGPKGKLHAIELLERSQEGAIRRLIYRANFDNANVIWNMRVTTDGKIIALEPQAE